MGGSHATARFHHVNRLDCGGNVAARSACAATGEDEAHRYRFPSAKVSDISVSGPPRYRAFFEELSRLGYVEGQNLGVERYSGEGRPERYAELARDVVNTHPDLIFAVGTSLSLDFKMATTTIPIVMVIGDPIASGLVASIARPRGNITGATVSGDWNSLENVWGCWSR